MDGLTGAILRANPAYELVLFDRLPAEQRDLLDGLRRDPSLFGVLWPRAESGGGLGVKSVCRDTALLLYTLREPGPLPAYVTAVDGAAAVEMVAELVLDGVLEIAAGDAFVSGPAALTLLRGPDVSSGTSRVGDSRDAATQSRTLSPAGSGTIARLSHEALRYAQALAPDDCARLSARLYFYNRVPASPRWARRLASRDAVADFLGLTHGTTSRRIAREWSALRADDGASGWLEWRARTPVAPPEHGDHSTWKLYVSPTCEQLPSAFAATLDVLAAAGAHHCKVGGDLYGVLRPDKLVAYFRSFEALVDAATAVRRALDGCPAQGVPFTAALGDDGLLSWGTDPPLAAQSLAWPERESWRLWLTNRLATALLAAVAAPAEELEPWQYALERLRLDHVDPETWTPDASIWHDRTAAARAVA